MHLIAAAPPIKQSFLLVRKLSVFSSLQPHQLRFWHDPHNAELPAASGAAMALRHLSTGHRCLARRWLSEERGSGQAPAQVIAVCLLNFPLQIQPPSFPVPNCGVVLQRVVKQPPCPAQRGLYFGGGWVQRAPRTVRKQARRARG